MRLRKFLTASGALDQLAHLLEEEVELLTTPTEQAVLLREVAKLRAASLHDAAGAVSLLERAVALVPDDRAALLALCDLYIAAGRTPTRSRCSKIIASYGGRRAKEVAVYEHRLGQAHERVGNVDEALKHYDAAFKIDLTSVPVLRDLGRVCLERGDLDRAQKTYRALLLQKLGPDAGISKADVYFRLGEISTQQGDKAKAKAMLERAIAGSRPAPGSQGAARELVMSADVCARGVARWVARTTAAALSSVHGRARLHRRRAVSAASSQGLGLRPRLSVRRQRLRGHAHVRRRTLPRARASGASVSVVRARAHSPSRGRSKASRATCIERSRTLACRSATCA